MNLRVLLDLDQVLADFEGHFLKEFRKKYPDEPCVELEDREGFWLRDQYDDIKPGLSVGLYSWRFGNYVNYSNKNIATGKKSIHIIFFLFLEENILWVLIRRALRCF